MEYTDRLIKGHGKYVADIALPEMLYMEVVRSKVARGNIVSVKGGISASDKNFYLGSSGEGYGEGNAGVKQPAFAEKYVSYYGQPVAAVYSSSKYAAKDLAESVEIKIEPLEPVVTLDQALKLPSIHPSMGSNRASEFTLGSEFAEKGDISVEDELYLERVVTDPLETRGIVSLYRDGVLNVWISTQSVYSIRDGLSAALGLPRDALRVMQADTGGAFGSKSAVYPEYVIASYISMKTGKPVKWTESREEHLMASRPGRGALGRLRLSATKDGKIVGLKGEVVVDIGAYGDMLGLNSPAWIARQLTGPYAIPNAYLKATALYTNKAPLGPYRGAGRPEASFFMERMIDLLADKLGIDPAELRLKNATESTFNSPLGLVVNASRQFLERGLRETGYWDMGAGKGLSFFVLIPAVFGGESARISVKDGRINIWLGGNAHWQRHELFVKKIVSEVTGVPEEYIELNKGNTGELGYGVGTWGSRSAIAAGQAVYRAALKIREIAEKEGKDVLSGSYDYSVMENMTLDPSMISFLLTVTSANLNEVGDPVIKSCTAFYDVGEPLSKTSITGQITGGLAQAVSEVLFESQTYDQKGKPEAQTISEAGVPYAHQLPKFRVIIAQEGKSGTLHGAKGVGEAGTVGGLPSITRAVESITGKRIRKLPVMYGTQ
ncbi:MAG: xanthine dehydrogenase family protein molybdopterin-binding subunit [Nitrososphaerota archaeon]|nr:xanthine dehydrogenase family protein molybdopterin-binding subunit [Nitrososphaerota archaeon]MDG6931233.1 xanthine dehydrogenase family protein molybdopterin-binding subunit [Nitrososphaerota archaeon]